MQKKLKLILLIVMSMSVLHLLMGDVLKMIDPKYYKDSIGLPCVGCGYCCMRVQCRLSVTKYGIQKVCPGLEWNGQRHICVWAIEYPHILAIGAGCSSSLLNSWRENICDRRDEVMQ